MQTKIVFYSTYIGLLAIVIGIAIAIVQAFRSNGEIEYCYIESTTPAGIPQVFYRLHGFRPWRPDVIMGTFPNFEKAAEAADLVHCSLRK